MHGMFLSVQKAILCVYYLTFVLFFFFKYVTREGFFAITQRFSSSSYTSSLMFCYWSRKKCLQAIQKISFSTLSPPPLCLSIWAGKLCVYWQLKVSHPLILCVYLKRILRSRHILFPAVGPTTALHEEEYIAWDWTSSQYIYNSFGGAPACIVMFNVAVPPSSWTQRSIHHVFVVHIYCPLASQYIFVLFALSLSPAPPLSL